MRAAIGGDKDLVVYPQKGPDRAGTPIRFEPAKHCNFEDNCFGKCIS